MKTVVGSFDDFDEAKQVARALMDEGFRDGDVNVIASGASGYSGTGTSTATTGVAGEVSGSEAAARLGDGDAPGALHASSRMPRSAPVTTDGGGLTDLASSHDTTVDDASGAAAGAVTGGVVGGAAGLAASLMGLAIPGIGPIIAAGPIVALLSGAGVGAVAGGLIGGLTDMGVSKSDAEAYAEAVRRGGALVTVRADEARAARAAEIMREHGAVDIERRADRWRERGWTGFDQSAEPYSPDEVARERDLYGDTDRATGIASDRGAVDIAPGSASEREAGASGLDRARRPGPGARTY